MEPEKLRFAKTLKRCEQKLLGRAAMRVRISRFESLVRRTSPQKVRAAGPVPSWQPSGPDLFGPNLSDSPPSRSDRCTPVSIGRSILVKKSAGNAYFICKPVPNSGKQPAGTTLALLPYGVPDNGPRPIASKPPETGIAGLQQFSQLWAIWACAPWRGPSNPTDAGGSQQARRRGLQPHAPDALRQGLLTRRR
jgi:hypothetical protein